MDLRAAMAAPNTMRQPCQCHGHSDSSSPKGEGPCGVRARVRKSDADATPMSGVRHRKGGKTGSVRHPRGERQLASRTEVHRKLGPRRKGTREDLACERILEMLLEGSLERPCAVLNVPSRLGEERLGALGYLDAQVATFQALGESPQVDVHDE